MRVIKRHIMALSFVFLLALPALGNEAKESNMTLNKKYTILTQRAEQLQLENTETLDKLNAICDAVRNLKGNDALENIKVQKTSLIFLLFQIIDKNYNPDYETPRLNISPPVRDGIVYDSGISPESISNPQTRAEYEKALEENKIKAEIAAFQLKLGRIRDGWMDYMKGYIKQNYKDEKQINKLIDENVTKEESRKELKTKFNEKKASKT